MNTTHISFKDLEAKKLFIEHHRILDGDILRKYITNLVLIGDWTAAAKSKGMGRLINSAYIRSSYEDA